MRSFQSSNVLSRCIFLAAVICILFASACSGSLTGTSPVDSSNTSNVSSPAATAETVVIAGPGTPSSIPVILAAKNMSNATVEIIENTSQANTAFLRGDIDILVSGLSVGVDMFRNKAPVQIVNTSVNGMSFLVTNGEKVESLKDLKGKEIYVPFEGSPIEEAVSYLAEQEGLVWGEDIQPLYSPFDGSVALLKQGKAGAVVLPEPFVSLVEDHPDVYISLDLFSAWNASTKMDDGYPQVAAFVRRDWAATHKNELAEFNKNLSDAVVLLQEKPNEAVSKVDGYFKQPETVLLKAVNRMQYLVLTGRGMQTSVTQYYERIGKPLDDGFEDFYYLP